MDSTGAPHGHSSKYCPADSQSLPLASQMETRPLPRDLEKRVRFRKFLKVRTMVFGVVAVTLLPIGLPLAIAFRGTDSNREAWAVGLLMSIVGGVCAMIFLIYLPIFMRLMAIRSQTVAYQPRSADALTNETYPRQTDITTPMVAEGSFPQEFLQAAENPNYSPGDPLLPLYPSAPSAPPPLPTEEPPRYDYVQRDPRYFNMPYPPT